MAHGTAGTLKLDVVCVVIQIIFCSAFYLNVTLKRKQISAGLVPLTVDALDASNVFQLFNFLPFNGHPRKNAWNFSNTNWLVFYANVNHNHSLFFTLQFFDPAVCFLINIYQTV